MQAGQDVEWEKEKHEQRESRDPKSAASCRRVSSENPDAPTNMQPLQSGDLIEGMRHSIVVLAIALKMKIQITIHRIK